MLLTWIGHSNNYKNGTVTHEHIKRADLNPPLAGYRGTLNKPVIILHCC